MKRKLIFILYTVIIIIVALINIISIKKFFDKKQEKMDIAWNQSSNYVVNFVSYNIQEPQQVVTEPVVEEEVVSDPVEEEPVTTEVVSEETNVNLEIPKAEEQEEVVVDNILFDGLTEQELIDKLNRSLKNELSGTAVDFVNYYKSTGLDPYLAIAIILHETGCSWTCSNLVKVCFNFGGMKGGPNYYNGTSYTCFASKEEGINAYLNMLYNNYYSKGLVTPELMNPKYAASMAWSAKINQYINKIKNA